MLLTIEVFAIWANELYLFIDELTSYEEKKEKINKEEKRPILKVRRQKKHNQIESDIPSLQIRLFLMNYIEKTWLGIFRHKLLQAFSN
ncbi:hypothetical protein BpHYR1_044520 [Brachionus plicatilis]|uniref:Uncharacterized protein n=1 Tax=Brachionus plicatilis TaxID=10195 RepID=A0A3M7SZ52_BRAPC|nr:hypothetical protein BpHYR1_044520 [Brachionus plicatilis]